MEAKALANCLLSEVKCLSRRLSKYPALNVIALYRTAVQANQCYRTTRVPRCKMWILLNWISKNSNKIIHHSNLLVILKLDQTGKKKCWWLSGWVLRLAGSVLTMWSRSSREHIMMVPITAGQSCFFDVGGRAAVPLSLLLQPAVAVAANA